MFLLWKSVFHGKFSLVWHYHSFHPYLVSGLLLLFLVRPQFSSIKGIGKLTFLLMVISVGIVIWFTIDIKNTVNVYAGDSLILGLLTWFAGFFGGLSIITFNSYKLFGVNLKSAKRKPLD